MNYGNPHRDMFVPNFPGRPANMRRYEKNIKPRKTQRRERDPMGLGNRNLGFPGYQPKYNFPILHKVNVGPMSAQAYKPGYPTEMDYLSDPFREIDPGSLLFPDSPYDNAEEEEDMYMNYSRGPLYFG